MKKIKINKLAEAFATPNEKLLHKNFNLVDRKTDSMLSTLESHAELHNDTLEKLDNLINETDEKINDLQTPIKALKQAIGELDSKSSTNLSKEIDKMSRSHILTIKVVENNVEKLKVYTEKEVDKIKKDIEELYWTRKAQISQNNVSSTLKVFSGSTQIGNNISNINFRNNLTSTLNPDGSVTVDSAAGSAITLKTNGTNNGSQSILNLKQGTNITIADDGVGGVTVNSTASGSTPTGTGFTHITAGVQDAAAKLVDTADINSNQVTNAKLSQMTANTIKGNNTGVTSNASDLTATQVKALLATTLADVSSNSIDATKSLYQMTSTVPVEFRASDASALLYLDETNKRIGIGQNTPTAKLHILEPVVVTSNIVPVGQTVQVWENGIANSKKATIELVHTYDPINSFDVWSFLIKTGYNSVTYPQLTPAIGFGSQYGAPNFLLKGLGISFVNTGISIYESGFPTANSLRTTLNSTGSFYVEDNTSEDSMIFSYAGGFRVTTAYNSLFLLNSGRALGGTVLKGTAASNVPLIVKGAASQTGDLEQWQNSAAGVLARLSAAGYLGIGVTPTAQVHMAAGTATAGTAPLKLTTGIALTTTEDGAIEYHASHLYFTIGTTRYQLDQQGGGGLTVGTTTITSGTNTRMLYDDGGVVGETVSGSYIKATGYFGFGATAPISRIETLDTTTAASENVFTSFPTFSTRSDSLTVGYSFNIPTPLSVSRLGRYWFSGNTLNHLIGIYREDGTLITSGTVLNASTTEADGCKYVSITPVTLDPAFLYYLVSYEQGTDVYADASALASGTYSKYIKLGNSAYGAGGSINFPNNLGTTRQTYSFPTATFNAIASPQFTSGYNTSKYLQIVTSTVGNNAIIGADSTKPLAIVSPLAVGKGDVTAGYQLDVSGSSYFKAVTPIAINNFQNTLYLGQASVPTSVPGVGARGNYLILGSGGSGILLGYDAGDSVVVGSDLSLISKFSVGTTSISQVAQIISGLASQTADLLRFNNNSSTVLTRVTAAGYIGIGITPTAQLHITAGTSTAGTSQIKLGASTLLATPENGAIEGTATHIYYTAGGVRYQLDQQSGGSGIVRSISSVSTPTTAGATASTDYVYLVSGATTLTLPTAVGNTNRYTVKNVGSGTVTVATTAAQTIDGGSTAVLTASLQGSIDLVSDNSNWNIT